LDAQKSSPSTPAKAASAPLTQGAANADYTTITELSGTPITRDQIRRQYNRYRFASAYCAGKDVLEMGCGAGQGLGYLAKTARKVVGGDIDPANLEVARHTYGSRIELRQLDAHKLDCPDQSFDVIILYEAIYYLEFPEKFAAEVRRVLRPGGVLLICTANKSLPDFVASPYSHRYFTPPELAELLRPLGFEVEFFGEDPVNLNSPKQRLVRFLKRVASKLNLVPKTMRGKQFLKRIFFGKLQPMPAEVCDGMAPVQPPAPISGDKPDTQHRVLHCVARVASSGKR
jgi:SAM-dependent methyltransferase